MLRQDGIVIRFALLESMAFILVEIPPAGSSGTSVEAPCVKPHWGFALGGEIAFETDGHRQVIQPGSAFHIPAGGPSHRFRSNGAARIAAFEPIDPVADTSDSALVAQGFEVLGSELLGAEATVIPAMVPPRLAARQVDSRAWAMSSFVLTQAHFGPGTGYTTDWCDAPHWGLVTAGRLAIEFENDVEVLAAGDVYHCQAGPPGHRIDAADPASVVDLTPIDAFATEERISLWRRRAMENLQGSVPTERIAVAGLG
jgi:quercetin dioxygenase-like cupin family protein